MLPISKRRNPERFQEVRRSIRGEVWNAMQVPYIPLLWYPAVDNNSAAGDPAAHVAGEKDGRVPDFRRVGIAAQRGVGGDGFEHFC